MIKSKNELLIKLLLVKIYDTSIFILCELIC
jgi:hypothetical protein